MSDEMKAAELMGLLNVAAIAAKDLREKHGCNVVLSLFDGGVTVGVAHPHKGELVTFQRALRWDEIESFRGNKMVMEIAKLWQLAQDAIAERIKQTNPLPVLAPGTEVMQ